MAHKAAGLLGKLVAGHNPNSNKRPTKAQLQAQRRRAVRRARMGSVYSLAKLDDCLSNMALPAGRKRAADGETYKVDWRPTEQQLQLVCQLSAIANRLCKQAVMAVAEGAPVDIDLATTAANAIAGGTWSESRLATVKAHRLPAAIRDKRLQAVKSAAHEAQRALRDLDSAISQMAYANGSTARKDWQPTAAQWLLMYQLDAIRHSLSIKALLAVADGKPVDIDLATAVGKARHKQARRVEAVAAAAAARS